MDPVSIVGLVGASMAIAARVADLVSTIPRLVATFRDTERSIRRLGSQLELFQGTVTQLGEWLQRSPRVSPRVKDTLNASLISCRDVIDDIEAHIKRVMPPEDDGALRIWGRTRHAWDETCADQWEQRVLNQMHMMDIYVRMLHLNSTTDQDSVLKSHSAVTAIERSNDDAKTVRSAWGEEDTETLTPSQRAKPTPSKQAKRRSMVARLKSFTLSAKTRRELSYELVNACRNRNIARIHDLMGQGASPNDAATDGITPLVAAVQTGQFTVTEVMLQYGAQISGGYPLVAAMATGNATLVRLLIQHGAAVVSKSSTSRPPLFEAIETDNADIVTALLEAGADSDMHTFGGEIGHVTGWLPRLGTPLFFALGRGKVPVVQTLLDYGADVNQVYANPGPGEDNLKFTPLCYVLCHKVDNTEELVQLLVDRGADADQPCGLVAKERFSDERQQVFGYSSVEVTGQNAVGLARARPGGYGPFTGDSDLVKFLRREVPRLTSRRSSSWSSSSDD
ncbi:hypothetical protein ACJ41O_008717 [Fusarium nematophilum]